MHRVYLFIFLSLLGFMWVPYIWKFLFFSWLKCSSNIERCTLKMRIDYSISFQLEPFHNFLIDFWMVLVIVYKIQICFKLIHFSHCLWIQFYDNELQVIIIPFTLLLLTAVMLCVKIPFLKYVYFSSLLFKKINKIKLE